MENLDPARCESTLEGLPVIWIDEAAELRDTHVSVCGLGTTKRSRYTEQAAALGLRFATLVHPTARVSSRSTLGEGTVVSAGAVVGAHTHAGRHILISAGVLVGHHTRLDDHASLMIGANVAGSCVIGSGVYIGMGARVLDHRRVAAGAAVGAGAVVASDLPERVLALGVPARIVQEDVEAP